MLFVTEEATHVAIKVSYNGQGTSSPHRRRVSGLLEPRIAG